MMKICIICRTKKEEKNFNDEHVIPDSIQGYYHIYKVCTVCNSKLGTNIDQTLTNHKFIEFQRFLFNIKGKKGNIPNPFKGMHMLKDEPEQKVVLDVDSEGKFTPRLLPNITELKTESLTDSFTISIDKKDEKNLDKIVDKILKRNGIDKNKITQTKTYSEIEHPYIQTTLKIDTQNFKAGMLKIAYEFAVDKIPEYFDDAQAFVISSILENADFVNLDKKVTFLGNGFDKEVLKPFEHLIEFENKNHYLILLSSRFGLLCFINLFNTFSICIKLSEKSVYIQDNLIVGKNDLEEKSFKVYGIIELLQNTYTPIRYIFQHHFPDKESENEFLEMKKQNDFGYYYENGKIAFYDNNGNIVYDNINDKLLSLEKKSKGDTKNSIITEFTLDEELYIKLLPSKKLYAVVLVRFEQFRISKI